MFAVCDLSELGLKRLLFVCSPVWILDISNIWKYHAKVRTTDIHNIVLYAKILFHGRKTLWILRLFNINSALPSLWQLHVTGAVGRSTSWQLKSAFLMANGFLSDCCINTSWFLKANNIKPVLPKLISYCFSEFLVSARQSGKLNFQKRYYLYFLASKIFFQIAHSFKKRFWKNR